MASIEYRMCPHADSQDMGHVYASRPGRERLRHEAVPHQARHAAVESRTGEGDAHAFHNLNRPHAQPSTMTRVRPFGDPTATRSSPYQLSRMPYTLATAPLLRPLSRRRSLSRPPFMGPIHTICGILWGGLTLSCLVQHG